MSARVLCAVAVIAAALAGGMRPTPPADVQRSLLREPAGPAFAADGRWPIDMMRLPAAWDISFGSSPGPLVAVIDTGVRVTSDLGGRVISQSVADGGTTTDTIGHGTKVAGIVAA